MSGCMPAALLPVPWLQCVMCVKRHIKSSSEGEANAKQELHGWQCGRNNRGVQARFGGTVPNHGG